MWSYFIQVDIVGAWISSVEYQRWNREITATLTRTDVITVTEQTAAVMVPGMKPWTSPALFLCVFFQKKIRINWLPRSQPGLQFICTLLSQSYLGYSATFHPGVRHVLTQYEPLVGVEMFLCIEEIVMVTPTEEIAHTAVIKGGQAWKRRKFRALMRQCPLLWCGIGTSYKEPTHVPEALVSFKKRWQHTHE